MAWALIITAVYIVSYGFLLLATVLVLLEKDRVHQVHHRRSQPQAQGRLSRPPARQPRPRNLPAIIARLTADPDDLQHPPADSKKALTSRQSRPHRLI